MSLGSIIVSSLVGLHWRLPPVACVAGLCASVGGSCLRPVTAAVAGRRETLSYSPVEYDGCDWIFAAAELGLTRWFLPFDADDMRPGGMSSLTSSSTTTTL